MPFAFGFAGILLLVAGVRGTQDDLFALLKGDFSGKSNFLYWIVAIAIVGAIGYNVKLRGVSHAFMLLLLVVLFLSNGGVFKKFTDQIGTTQSGTSQSGAAASTPVSTLPDIRSIFNGANSLPIAGF
jgi:hypothetical protein